MPEETVVEETPVDESMMSASELIAKEMESQEAEAAGEETEEEGKEAGTEGTEDAEGEPTGEEGDKIPDRAFTAFTDDKESDDYKALDDLTVKFRANKEDQSLTVEEMVRQVQKGAGIANALKTRTRERDETNQELTQRTEELTKAQANGDLLLKVLQDPKAYEELKTKYLEAGGTSTPVPEGQKGEPLGDQPSVEEQYMASGRGVVEDSILPYSKQLAEAYGADHQEIAQEIIALAGQVPQKYFSEEKLHAIITEEIPQLLREAGFEASGDLPEWTGTGGSANGDRAYGIQKKGSAARGETEKETKMARYIGRSYRRRAQIRRRIYIAAALVIIAVIVLVYVSRLTIL